MDASVLESFKTPISGQFMACGSELNCDSDTSFHSVKDTRYAARLFYNSAVRPRYIDNLLAIKFLDEESVLVSMLFTDKKPGGQYKMSSHPVVQLQLCSYLLKPDNANNVQFNVTRKAVKGLGHGLNTTNWQHTQVSAVIGQGLNPIQIHKLVDSELMNAQHITNHSDDTVPRNENIGCRGSVNSHRHSNACKDLPDRSMGLDPTNHSNKVIPGSNLVNQDSVIPPRMIWLSVRVRYHFMMPILWVLRKNLLTEFISDKNLMNHRSLL